MATSPVSRNSFAASAQLSLADLIGRIEETTEIPKTTRQNWCWALRTIARVAGKDPEAIPAHPDFLRRLSAKSAPIAAGLSPGAWNNAKSLMTKAMAWSGLISVPGRYQTPFTAEWQSLWSLLPARQALARQLGRFFHYCSANDIRFRDIDDAVLCRFHEALVQESLIGKPYEAYRGAAKSWNNAREQIPGWPQTLVTVPSKRDKPFCLPWSAFPASLSGEIEAHLTSLAGFDLDSDIGRPMRPATIQKRRKQLCWLASALVHSGVEASSLRRLEDLLEPGMAKRGLQFLLDRRGAQTFTALDNLAQFLPALARRLGVADETVATLKRFKQRLKFRRHGLAERHRATLQRIDDPEAVEALVNLPRRLREQVQRSGRKGTREARLLQTAVAIDLLLFTALRISNLASIEIDRHLVVVQIKPRQVHVRFPGSEVKNDVDLEYPLSAETVDLLDLYRQDFRQLLAEQPGKYLFPGKQSGRSKGSNGLSQQVKETVRKYTGLEMPAHRFRHAVAKIFLDRNPGQYEVVRQLLGHKNIKTTIEFYAGAEGAAAARHYSATILKLRNPKKDGTDGA